MILTISEKQHTTDHIQHWKYIKNYKQKLIDGSYWFVQNATI